LAPDALFSSIDDQGRALVSHVYVERTSASIARVSQRAALAYREFSTFALQANAGAGLYVPPSSTGEMMATLEKSFEGQLVFEITQKSCFDVVNDWFENGRVKLHLLKVRGLRRDCARGKGNRRQSARHVFVLPQIFGALALVALSPFRD
jgi:hypothetical protein